MILEFDSIATFAARVAHVGATSASKRVRELTGAIRDFTNTSPSWYGTTYTNALALATTGDESIVAEAQALLESIESPDSIGKSWLPSCTGAYPIVAEYLAGDMQCMRQTQTVESDSMPIRIFAPINASSRVSPSAVRRRGLGILALILRLQTIRPVELYLYHAVSAKIDDSSDHKADIITLIHIETRPLELATACFAISHIAFLRRLVFTLEHSHWTTIEPTVQNGMHPERSMPTEKVIRQLSVTSYDVILPRILQDSDVPEIESMAAWVNSMVAKFSQLEQL